jgi:fucose permease
MLEHMMFKGTPSHNREKGNSLFLLLQQTGALLNATTGMDATDFYAMLPRERIPLVLGIVTLLLSAIVLVSIDDLTNPSSLPRVTAALLLVGVASGTLYPASIYYSQVLAPGKRGALAGLLMSAQFIGNALIPYLFEPFYEAGVRMLFDAILGTSILYLIVVAALYRKAPLRSQAAS